MTKRLFSIFLALILILTFTITAFAARRFSREKFDSLPTWESKAAYVDSIYEWYFTNTDYGNASVERPSDVDADFIALAYAGSWLRENLPGMTTKTSSDVTSRIAAIKKTYGIEFTLGADENGKYHQDAKIGPHLTNIEKGLSLMGAKLTKQLVRDYEATKSAQDEARDVGHIYPWRGKFRINLTPKQDIYNKDGTLEGFVNKYSSGMVILGGNNTNPVHLRDVVHEFGHAVINSLYIDQKERLPEIFQDTQYGNYGQGKGFIGNYGASKHPDRFVSSYAQTNAGEDYADTFAVAVINGGDNPLKYGSNTVVYKKVKIIYDDLVKYIGTGATATKRVGAYIGINPEK